MTETNDAGFAGVCRRRLGVCDECTTDAQCRSDATFDPAGRCRTMPGSTSTVKYCFLEAAGNGSCSIPGTSSVGGLCVPQSGKCDQVGCSEDKHCKSGKVCNKTTQLCEDRCRWIQQTLSTLPAVLCGRLLVDQVNLNPEAAFFGAGRCRPPCTNDAECTDTSLNPYGGPGLTCTNGPTKTG